MYFKMLRNGISVGKGRYQTSLHSHCSQASIGTYFVFA